MDSTHSSSTNSLPQIDKLTLNTSEQSAFPNNGNSNSNDAIPHYNHNHAHGPNKATATTTDLTSSPRLPQPSYQPDLEPRQRRPPPQPLRSSSSHLRSGHRSQLMTDIPCSADNYGPAGPSSASPSSWSTASSDTAPSSASPVIEMARYERLPNGGHRHHLSAPKRQQFLANQVRRLRELLDGKRDRDDHLLNPPPQQQQHGQHEPKSEVFKHSLSLLNEKYQDFETDPTGGPAGSHRRRHPVKTDFLQTYGELQQIIGKGNTAFRFQQLPHRGKMI